MFINAIPDIFHHFLFLLCRHPTIKLVRVDSRHQDNTVDFALVHWKIWIVPHFAESILVEANHCIFNSEGPQTREQFVEPQKRLAENVKSLFMIEIPAIDESEGYVFGEDSDVFMVGAEI